MLLVRPVEINDSTLVSSNVPADITAIWLVGTAYLIGDVVRVDATHHLYEAVTNNTGVYPPDNIGAAVPDWIDLGATNKWSMFDDTVGTTTTNLETIEVVVDPGGINTIGLLNIQANTALITMDSVGGGGEVYSREVNLVLPNVSNWYEYFFEPIVRETDLVCDDLPIYGDGIVTVTLSGGIADTIECGLFIAGRFRLLGVTQWGLGSGIIDYSVKEANQFGGFSVIKRAFSKRMDADIFMKNAQVDETQRVLAQYRATPVLYVGSNEFNVSIIYGYYRDFSVILTSPAGSHCSMTVEGLI